MKTNSPGKTITIFIGGMGKVLDLGNTISLFHRRHSVHRKASSRFRYIRSDADAIRSDWIAVGDDLRRAIELYRSQNGKE